MTYWHDRMPSVTVQPYADSHDSHNGLHFGHCEPLRLVYLNILTDIAYGMGYFMLQVF